MSRRHACFAHDHMTPEEFGLYEYARRVSHDSGVLYFDGPGIASQFGSTGKNTVYRIAKSLVVKGWFKVLKASNRNAVGIWDATQYVPVSHEDWAKSHPGQCHHPVPERGTAPFLERGTAPFPESGSTVPSFETNHSQFQVSPFPELGNKSVKNKSVKRSLKRKESEREVCSPSPSVTAPEPTPSHSLSDPSGGDKHPQDWKPEFLALVTAISHDEAQRQKRSTPVITKKAEAELCESVRKLKKPIYECEIRVGVRQFVGACDEFLMRNFGSHLATNLAALIQAERRRVDREVAEEDAATERRWAENQKRFVCELTPLLGEPETFDGPNGEPCPMWTVGNHRFYTDCGRVDVFIRVGADSDDAWQSSAQYSPGQVSELIQFVKSLHRLRVNHADAIC